MNKVAILIPSYNMPERAEALVEFISNHVEYPHDTILIDNGSDIKLPSIYSTITLAENIQTTGAWLMGLHYADMLALKYHQPYFAYWFLITSAEFVGTADVLAPMAELLESDPNAVGVHPALTEDSTTSWKHLIERGTNVPRQTWMIDNIASLYRADWFDSIGRFDPEMRYAWGIDLETCYIARRDNRSLWVDERVKVKKVTNIGYNMNRMKMSASEREQLAGENMRSVLYKKYGSNYWRMMMEANVKDEWR